MYTLLLLERSINRIADVLGWIASTLFLLLVINVFYNVVMRYVFNQVSIGSQELEWHLFSAVFLLGIPYALKTGGHVRIDVFYERWPQKIQAVIDLLGCLILLLPFSFLIFYFGLDFTREAYQLGEGSGDPGGLPHRWVIKGMIPVSFLFLFLIGISNSLNAIQRLMSNDQIKE
ncbi:Tripartite ATP-independent periplasmic transporters, DctQ component [Grimontia celer]|uniref:TRAP transporter small permease protein n=1 Tax=Grimontia celer TaxID=1796497 RepID=A0A128EZ32_9GAMM|nr:TRAP transporter small permease subunit [Grimontia celer]CZF79515.1 Tripartite ATP-independent periplasmic transporters, DctQ component [Grimontia celer]